MRDAKPESLDSLSKLAASTIRVLFDCTYQIARGPPKGKENPPGFWELVPAARFLHGSGLIRPARQG